MKLARWRTWEKGSRTALSQINRIAHQQAWSISEHQLKKAIEHENVRVRVAAASAHYIQAMQDPNPEDLFKEPIPDFVFRLTPDDLAALDFDQTRKPQFQLAAVWRQLLEERTELNTNIPVQGDEETYDAYRKRREKYSRTMEESLELLHHLYHMVAFDDPDPALIDLCLNSVGYSDGFIHLVRHHENQNITMTGDQLDLTAQWIDNPFISEDHREGIIDGLIRLDHRPAAEAIAGYYQRLGLLDDELNALAKTGVNPKGVPGIRRLAPEKVAWLQKHAE